jgi:hypothetical protein
MSGSTAAVGGQPRRLLEAASDGRLGSALAGVPHATRALLQNATREGFLAGMNAILVIGAVLAFAGALVALWLVRESRIEREQPETVGAPAEQVEALAA